MKIDLVAPPGVPIYLPSLGLSRMKAVLKQKEDEGKVIVNIDYLNYEFYNYFGDKFYMSMQNNIGMGYEETFRYTAFDILPERKVLKQFKLNEEFYFSHRSLHAEIVEKIIKLPEFFEKIIVKYELTDYDLIGFTAGFSLTPALAFCRLLKQKKPEIITVLGGTLVLRENGKAWIKHSPFIDYIASGPAMISFPQLVNALLKNDKNKINNIQGILTKKNYDQIDLCGLEIDINNDPVLDYSDFITAFYKNKMQKKFKPRLILETSKGCLWGKCRFCNHHKYDVNKQVQDHDVTIRKINTLLKKYPKLSIHIIDSFIQERALLKVLPNINYRKNQSIMFHTKANLKADTVKMFAENNVYLFEPGIESLSTPVLRLMNKGTNAFVNIKLLKICMHNGIVPSWNYLIGIPGMSDEDYDREIANLPLFYHIYPGPIFNINFLRWSPYWEEQDAYNLKLVPHPLYRKMYPFNTDFINDVAFAYVDIQNNEGSVNNLLKKYSHKIMEKSKIWFQKWDLKTIKNIPKLHFIKKKNSVGIYDSRYDTIEKYEIPKPVYDILIYCNSEKKQQDIISHYYALEGKITGYLEFIKEKKLVFQEKDRILNLVFDFYPKNFYKRIYKEKDSRQFFI